MTRVRKSPVRRTSTRRTHTPAPAASVVDIFCGAGGLSHGFVQRGFQIAAGIDVDEACRYAFEHNNKAPLLRRDVTEVTAADIEKLFVPGRTRVLVGCAPCQPFSTYNQKNDDPKWELLGHFGDLVVQVLPDIVSMENVPRLLEFQGGKLFETFLQKLKSNGYEVAYDVLYGPDYGLAQTRSRLVMLASRLGPISLPAKTHKKRHRTVRDEIGMLPEISHGEAHGSDPLHRSSRLNPTNVERIKASKPGGTWRDWDKRLVATCHSVETGKTYSSVYGRMEWDAPSPTITTQFFGFGNGRFGHPDQTRALSLREGALLQGFPRDYQFVRPGERVQFKAIGRLIGNAVPVKLGYAIAGAVRQHLEALEA